MIKGIIRKILLLILALSLLIATINWLFPPQHRVKELRYSKVFYDRNKVLLGAKLSPDDKWRFKVALKDVSPELVKALLEFEDKRFYEHHGVDLLAVFRALKQNVTSGRIVSGASTISMQTARLLWKTHRNGLFPGKFYQVFRALQLELSYSKDEILELYFNLAPYGKNIEGVGAAAQFYFNKPPNKLSWTEAIAMAIAPKSPNRYRLDRFSEAARMLCNKTARSLIEKKSIDPVDQLFITCDQIPGKLAPLPFKARHLVDRLYTNSKANTPLVNQPEVSGNQELNNVNTTIDLKFQEDLERVVINRLEQIRSVNVPHASVLVIENKTRNVLVYIGSPDFFGKLGQVDGARALRSPGSTLKPFLYSLAMQTGEYNTHSFLPNVPISYLGYRPQNYNRDDIGIVNLTQALQHSLNLPAVELNVRLGKDNDLYHFLQQAKVSSLVYSREQYGQNIVLGGAEMRLDELTALYAMLANQGVFKSIHLTLDHQSGSFEKQMLSPDAVFIVSRILRDTPIPKYKTHSSVFRDVPDVAWKTGTSSRRRDAWTIGYSPDYTVGVWLGDFTGVSINEMSGRQIAAPLFFDVMRYLHQNGMTPWPSEPDAVIKTKVCDISGDLPHKDCMGTVEALLIAGKTTPKFCSMHQGLLIEKKSGLRLSPQCIETLGLSENDYVRKRAIRWPKETASWLAANHSVTLIPLYKEGCEPPSLLNGEPPRLQTPLDGEHYLVDFNAAYDPTTINFGKMVFSVAVSNEVHFVDWYLNSKKLGTTKTGETLLWDPQKGKHELAVIDNYGRKSTARFKVSAK